MSLRDKTRYSDPYNRGVARRARPRGGGSVLLRNTHTKEAHMDTNTSTERGAQRPESWRKNISEGMKRKWEEDPTYRARVWSDEHRLAHSADLASRRGEQANAWKGGRHPDPHGYIRITIPRDHPFAEMAQSDGTSLRILEHRLVMAEAIGRLLTPAEVVHHRNERKDDNRLENLLLLKSKAEHARLHALLSQGFSEEAALAGLDDPVREILLLIKRLAEMLEWLSVYQANYRSDGSLPWAT